MSKPARAKLSDLMGSLEAEVPPAPQKEPESAPLVALQPVPVPVARQEPVAAPAVSKPESPVVAEQKVIAPETAADKKAQKVADLDRVGLYLPPIVAKEIKKIAFAHDKKAHDIYLQAVDMVLKKYGRPSIKELTSLK